MLWNGVIIFCGGHVRWHGLLWYRTGQWRFPTWKQRHYERHYEGAHFAGYAEISWLRAGDWRSLGWRHSGLLSWWWHGVSLRIILLWSRRCGVWLAGGGSWRRLLPSSDDHVSELKAACLVSTQSPINQVKRTIVMRKAEVSTYKYKKMAKITKMTVRVIEPPCWSKYTKTRSLIISDQLMPCCCG